MICRAVKRVPCLFHPVTMLFLDDKRGFLDSLEMQLGKYGKMLTFTDPAAARKVLESAEEDIVKKITKTCGDTDTDALNEKLVDFDISSIKDLIYDSARFDYPAVLVIDYQMPDITGVDFCRNIQDSCHIYKIMLTAEAGKDTAIEAFNEGVIDKFIVKQNTNLYDQLIDYIDELKEKYFHDLSKPLLNSLGTSLRGTLESDVFVKLFNTVVQDSKAVEYYLLDMSGSYLFLDENGAPTWLIVRNSQDFSDQLDMLSGLDNSSELMTSLANKEKLLFLLSETEYQQSVDKWADCLFEAKQLDSSHWYAVVKGTIKESIEWNKIKPYEDFK